MSVAQTVQEGLILIRLAFVADSIWERGGGDRWPSDLPFSDSTARSSGTCYYSRGRMCTRPIAAWLQMRAFHSKGRREAFGVYTFCRVHCPSRRFIGSKCSGVHYLHPLPRDTMSISAVKISRTSPSSHIWTAFENLVKLAAAADIPLVGGAFGVASEVMATFSVSDVAYSTVPTVFTHDLTLACRGNPKLLQLPASIDISILGHIVGVRQLYDS